ncbi:M50 family metallopeptidase [Natronoglycomyces albus]|uniref:M50 family metallopeptidase n=1 Tax=Natronoglycomyces albus TaxID=2811108 RepID=A0A895XNB3_9ACTN|nr:M50 family metallopeptidase [Natronoglycomyces albus]QSB06844.1 M50 family metallopeptidase [Natronoglycomyces albus]
MDTTLADVWQWIVQSHPEPTWWAILGSAVVALVAVGQSTLWRQVRNLITIAHEGGHALVGVLTGRRLSGIRLHSDTSGLTITRGRPTGPGAILTLAAGYTAPALLGLGAAFLLAGGRTVILLWITFALLVAMVIFIRNLYGFVALVVVGAVVFSASWYATAEVQTTIAYLGTWILILGSIRPVFELRHRRRGKAGVQSDADQLASMTAIPAAGWIFFFMLVTIGAGAAGTWLLLPEAVTDTIVGVVAD